MTLKVQIIDSLLSIDEKVWDSCANSVEIQSLLGVPGKTLDPFTTYRFLRALEKSKCVGKGTGWYPQHLIVSRGKEVVAVVPMYLKTHSQGEYIFDHNWAQAYQNAGGFYYPKLQVCVPFTPVTGRRFLVKYPDDEEVVTKVLNYFKTFIKEKNLSSVHITFCEDYEQSLPKNKEFLSRETFQFHWENNEFYDFQNFMESLSSRKRKAIKRERRAAQEFGGRIEQFSGEDITRDHWDYFWEFYQDTGRRKWGQPYLTREFFEEMHTTMRDDILLILAIKDDVAVAGALNFIGAKTLFGRYWGATEYHKFLHYELCYYQAIEYAITHKLQKVEAGAQGDHKISRGYLPSKTYSLHWFKHQGMNEAIDHYLVGEKNSFDFDKEFIKKLSPYKEISQ